MKLFDVIELAQGLRSCQSPVMFIGNNLATFGALLMKVKCRDIYCQLGYNASRPGLDSRIA